MDSPAKYPGCLKKLSILIGRWTLDLLPASDEDVVAMRVELLPIGTNQLHKASRPIE